jgi:hypothetical protein
VHDFSEIILKRHKHYRPHGFLWIPMDFCGPKLAPTSQSLGMVPSTSDTAEGETSLR